MWPVRTLAPLGGLMLFAGLDAWPPHTRDGPGGSTAARSCERAAAAPPRSTPTRPVAPSRVHFKGGDTLDRVADLSPALPRDQLVARESGVRAAGLPAGLVAQPRTARLDERQAGSRSGGLGARASRRYLPVTPSLRCSARRSTEQVQRRCPPRTAPAAGTLSGAMQLGPRAALPPARESLARRSS